MRSKIARRYFYMIIEHQQTPIHAYLELLRPTKFIFQNKACNYRKLMRVLIL